MRFLDANIFYFYVFYKPKKVLSGKAMQMKCGYNGTPLSER